MTTRIMNINCIFYERSCKHPKKKNGFKACNLLSLDGICIEQRKNKKPPPSPVPPRKR